MTSKLEEFRQLYKLSKAGPLTRRYTVIGAFDGSLTALGIILGAAVTGLDDSTAIISAVVGGMLALGISSAWGAFEVEKIEQIRIARDRAAVLLEELPNTVHDKASDFATLWGAFVHGVAPIPAGLIPLVPFFFIQDFFTSALLASGIGLTFLFVLGFYMARIADLRGVVYGARMTLAGIITIIFVLLLGIQHL